MGSASPNVKQCWSSPAPIACIRPNDISGGGKPRAIVERKLFPLECVRVHPIPIDRDDHVVLFDKFLSSLKIYGEMNRIPTSPALLSDVRVDPRISP